MERMIARHRYINIISGHMGAGKSFYFKLLTSLPENKKRWVLTLSKDEVIAKYFGNRTPEWPADDFSQEHMLAIFDKMTPQERIYAEELLRVDVERAILAGGFDKIFLDASMRSREKHQESFVAMVRKVERLLGLIAGENADRQGLLPPVPAPRVELQVVFLYCDFETLRRRMAARWPDLPPDQIPPPVLETFPGIELPEAYPFLAVDTSDETPDAERRRIEKIKNFFSGRLADNTVLINGVKDAERCIAESKARMQEFAKKIA